MDGEGESDFVGGEPPASPDPAPVEDLGDPLPALAERLIDDPEERIRIRRALKPRVPKGKPRDEDDPDWHGKKRDRTQDRGATRRLKGASRRRQNVREFVEDVSLNPNHPLSPLYVATKPAFTPTLDSEPMKGSTAFDTPSTPIDPPTFGGGISGGGGSTESY